jgi:hypothetical protein
MTHEKKHSTLTLSQPEVYNKDLEKLVEVLQDKLEGLEIREEFLKGRVQELQTKFYKVGVNCDTTSYALGYFTTYDEAHTYLHREVSEYVKEPISVGTDSIYIRRKLGHDISNYTTIRSWTIDSIKFGETKSPEVSVRNLLTLARMGELIRVDGEGR